MKEYQSLTRALRADLDSPLGQSPIIGGKLRFLNVKPLIEHQLPGAADPLLAWCGSARDRVAGALPAAVFAPIANDNSADPTPPIFARGGAKIPPRPARARGLRPTFFEILNLLGRLLARTLREDARKFQQWIGGSGE